MCWPTYVPNVTQYMPHLGKIFSLILQHAVVSALPAPVFCKSLPICVNFVFSSQNSHHILTIESTPKNEEDNTIDSCVYEFHKNGVSTLIEDTIHESLYSKMIISFNLRYKELVQHPFH